MHNDPIHSFVILTWSRDNAITPAIADANDLYRSLVAVWYLLGARLDFTIDRFKVRWIPSDSGGRGEIWDVTYGETLVATFEMAEG